jgi:O-acetyl-ADP-ribose deacetylase (regulator of RNase III)
MLENIGDYQLHHTRVRLTYGDITQIEADILVSSDDNFLSMSSGVSAAIRRAGGEAIQRAARHYKQLQLGEIAITSAGNLSAKYVFHAVTIDAANLIYASEESIQLAILNCLKQADSLRMKTIAFPVLGTGVAGFPFEQAAEVMIKTLSDYLMNQTQIELVTITLFARPGMEPSQLNLFCQRAIHLLTAIDS